MAKDAPDFFSKDQARRYDERNGKLAPISEALHFATSLVLEDLPARARILSVGAGTGAEILSLARSFPGWSFVAVDPSQSMLEVCDERLRRAGLSERCELIHGFVQDVPAQPAFDAATALLVAHFVKREERLDFFRSITSRLRVGGTLVNAEISFDLESSEFPSMLRNWQAVQRLMGGTPESLKAVPQQLKEVLAVLSPDETASVLRSAEISSPVRFFQAFLITAWYGVRG
jgi:tRNA (cmo5U34)-methyltransferase